MAYSARWGRFAPLGGPRGPIGEQLLGRRELQEYLGNLPTVRNVQPGLGSVETDEPQPFRFIEAAPRVGDFALNAGNGAVVAGERA